MNWNADVLLHEDPGGRSLGQRPDTSAEHNPALFSPGSATLLTRDEKSSEIIDLSAILGEGYYLVNVQAQYALPDPLVEGGQLLAVNTNACELNPELTRRVQAQAGHGVRSARQERPLTAWMADSRRSMLTGLTM